MSFVPHNHFSPSDEVVHPAPDPHQDEAVALSRAARSPATAFIGLGLALAGAVATYSPVLLVVGALLAAAAILVSAFAWRRAHRQNRPGGVAVAGLLIGIITILVFIVLD